MKSGKKSERFSFFSFSTLKFVVPLRNGVCTFSDGEKKTEIKFGTKIQTEIVPQTKTDSSTRHCRSCLCYKSFFWILGILLFLAFFSAVLFSPRQFGYRDVAYFYYPLFEQIQQEWERGRIPLWDSYENLGQPLAANPTSSVFYPGKIIFFLSSLNFASYGFCFKWFILLHFPLAFATMFHFMKKQTHSNSAATIASIAYIYSGSVLFQYSNVVFLVGAAWFPLAIHWGIQWIRFEPFLQKQGNPNQCQRNKCQQYQDQKKENIAQSPDSLQKSPLFPNHDQQKTSTEAKLASVHFCIPFWRFLTDSTRKTKIFSLFGFSFVLSMMILGGEPQSAYLAILMLIGFAFFSSKGNAHQFRSSFSEGQLNQSQQEQSAFQNDSSPLERKKTKTSNRFLSPATVRVPLTNSFWRRWTGKIAVLFLASLLTLGLSAVQIFPSIEMTQSSERSLNFYPISVWDIPTYLVHSSSKTNQESSQLKQNADHSASNENNISGISQSPKQQYSTEANLFQNIQKSLFCQTIEKGGHPRAIYQFGVAPWRLFELVWGNIGGRPFPLHSRWMTALPNERTVWTPSLYFGVFPFLLAIIAMKMRRRRERDLIPVWATWAALFFILASLGGFGFFWLIRFFRFLLGSGENLTISNGDPVGGVYWLSVVFLPFFESFRYPAKMMFPATFSFCVLVGFGWLKFRSSLLLSRLVALIAILSLFLFVVVFFSPSYFFEVKMNPLDSLYGLYQPQLARLEILRSFLKTAIVLGLIWFILRGKQGLQSLIDIFSFNKVSFQWKNRFRKSRLFIFINSFQKIDKRNFSKKCRNISPLIILTVCSIDIYYSNSWLIETVPQAVFDRPSTFSQSIRENAEKMLVPEKTVISEKPFENSSDNRMDRNFEDQSKQNADSFSPNEKEQSSQIIFSKLYERLRSQNQSQNQTTSTEKMFDLSEMPIRVYRSPIWYPIQFYLKPSLNRSAERICWDQATLFPKYAYRNRIAVIDVRGTMMSADYFLLTNQLRQTETPESLLAFLDVHYLVYPFRRTPNLNKTTCFKSAEYYFSQFKNNLDKTINHSNANKQTNNQQKNQNPAPEITTIKKERLPLDAALWKITLPTSRTRIVHSKEKIKDRSTDEFAQIIHYQSDRIEMIVHLEKGADLILIEQYWKGWNAIAEPIILENRSPNNRQAFGPSQMNSAVHSVGRSQSDSSEPPLNISIEPYQKILRKISLPQGDYRVIMEYRPDSFYCGLFISLISCFGTFVIGIILIFHKNRQI